MNNPLFDSDIFCVRCGYWYPPEILNDDVHMCPSCLRRRNEAKKDNPAPLTRELRQIFQIAETESEECGMIYLVRGSKTKLIKIGYTSTSPLLRLRELQTGSPDILKCMGFLYGSFDTENRLHTALKNFRIHGEWFELPSYVLSVFHPKLRKPYL